MNHYNPSHPVIWSFVAELFIEFCLWLLWLFRFYSRPPRFAITLCIGLPSLLVGTAVCEVLLGFSLRETVGGKPPAFWFGIGYAVASFLSSTSMASIIIYSGEQLFKPLSNPRDPLRCHSDTRLWTLTALIGWAFTIAAIGLAAANLSAFALVLTASGGIIVQLACSMWLRGKIRQIVHRGLCVISTVGVLTIYVLLAILEYQDSNTTLFSTVALCLCAVQRTAILGQGLVVDFETIRNLARTGINALHLKRKWSNIDSSVGTHITIAMESVGELQGPPDNDDTKPSTASICSRASHLVGEELSTLPALPYHTEPSVLLPTKRPKSPSLAVSANIIIKTSDHQISSNTENGLIYITIANSSYSLDKLDCFARTLPWHKTRSGTYLLADFTKFLQDLYYNSSPNHPLNSISQKLRLSFNNALVAETKRNYYLRNRYHYWSILVGLDRAAVTVYVDSLGRITPIGHPVHTHIFELRAQEEDIRIWFTESQVSEYLQIPWNDVLNLSDRGVVIGHFHEATWEG